MKLRLKEIKERILWLFRLNNTPEEIALGVAIGVFIAILPVYGLHTFLVILLAILIRRSNKIAMFMGTSISNTLTLPFITWAGYSIGRCMLGKGYPEFSWAIFKTLNYPDLASLYYPLFIGSFILGILCAVIFYFMVSYFIKIKYKRRKIC